MESEKKSRESTLPKEEQCGNYSCDMRMKQASCECSPSGIQGQSFRGGCFIGQKRNQSIKNAMFYIIEIHQFSYKIDQIYGIYVP